MPNILVVDDEPAIRKVLASALSDQGWGETYTAETAESALELIEAKHPEVIISDIKLPGMNGVELARRVKSDGDGATVLLMSAYGEPAHHDADAFIPKPFGLDEVIALVREYLK